MTATPRDVIIGLRLLADILQTTTVSGPREISRCILADTDAEGTEALDYIGFRLEYNNIEHHVKDTDNAREITIPLADGFEYRIFYIYRSAMKYHCAQDSYYANIIVDTEVQ